jgi:hypothetical protein
MDAGTLYKAISEVCPIITAKVDSPTDRATWSYEATAAATQPQKDAADNVIQTIPLTPVPPADSGEFINRFTDAEYLLLKERHAADLQLNDARSIRIWDIVIGNNNLDLNSADAQTLKAGLVSGNILTQARADVIFGAAVSGTKKRF